MTIQITQQNLSKLMIESVRYCLGRNTYAVSECSDVVRLHWKDIGNCAKTVIKRDIEQQIQHHNDYIKQKDNLLAEGYSPLGHECDAFTWIELLNWIEAQEKENERN